MSLCTRDKWQSELRRQRPMKRVSCVPVQSDMGHGVLSEYLEARLEVNDRRNN